MPSLLKISWLASRLSFCGLLSRPTQTWLDERLCEHELAPVGEPSRRFPVALVELRGLQHLVDDAEGEIAERGSSVHEQRAEHGMSHEWAHPGHDGRELSSANYKLQGPKRLPGKLTCQGEHPVSVGNGFCTLPLWWARSFSGPAISLLAQMLLKPGP